MGHRDYGAASPHAHTKLKPLNAEAQSRRGKPKLEKNSVLFDLFKTHNFKIRGKNRENLGFPLRISVSLRLGVEGFCIFPRISD